MALSKKLMKRKSWYTLEDTAKRISVEAGAEVTTKDLLQLALDDELTLSVIIQWQPARKETKLDKPVIKHGLELATALEKEAKHRLDGVYDLDVNTEATQVIFTSWIIDDPEYGLNFGSWCVIDPENPNNRFHMCKYIEDEEGEFRIVDADPVPDLSRVIVKREALDAFIASLAEEAPELKIADDTKALEAMGLLAETYVKERAPDYWFGDKPKVSRIVDDMLAAKPEDVTKMSRRKLQDIVSDALKAWEAKKRA